MSSGQQQPQNIVTTQNKEPWEGAKPTLAGVMGAANALYASDSGYQPYTGQTVASMTPDQANAIGGIRGMAYQGATGTPGVNAARGLAQDVIGSQGITPDIQGAIGGLGQTSGLYGGIYSDASGQTNPYLQAALDAQGRKIADQVNSTMSGAGRYGSGAHTNVLSRNLAEAADPILAQDYQNRQQTRLAAAQGLGATQSQIADLYGQGLTRAGQYSQLIPSLDEARYADLNKIMATGDWERDINQQNISAAVNLYNAQQARPWEQVARLNAIASGAGGLGGSQVTTQPNLNVPVSGLQRGLGGALAGAGIGGSIFGPAGAAIGGLGGGLLGYL